jgi:hypothetical protein
MILHPIMMRLSHLSVRTNPVNGQTPATPTLTLYLERITTPGARVPTSAGIVDYTGSSSTPHNFFEKQFQWELRSRPMR